MTNHFGFGKSAAEVLKKVGVGAVATFFAFNVGASSATAHPYDRRDDRDNMRHDDRHDYGPRHEDNRKWWQKVFTVERDGGRHDRERGERFFDRDGDHGRGWFNAFLADVILVSINPRFNDREEFPRFVRDEWSSYPNEEIFLATEREHYIDAYGYQRDVIVADIALSNGTVTAYTQQGVFEKTQILTDRIGNEDRNNPYQYETDLRSLHNYQNAYQVLTGRSLVAALRPAEFLGAPRQGMVYEAP